MKQLSLDEALTGEQLRDEALERVEAAANDTWKTEALHVVRHLSAMGTSFTTDDVWSRLTGVATPEPRAMGPVMLAAQRAGYCYPTDRFRKSRRPEHHAGPIRVWQGYGAGIPL